MASNGVTRPRHRTMAMLRLQQQQLPPPWTWTAEPSSSSSSLQIRFTTQVSRPARAATLKIRNSSGTWGQPRGHHHQQQRHHQSEDFNSWTPPPSPSPPQQQFPPSIVDAEPLITVQSTKPTAASAASPALLSPQESWRPYYLLLLDRDQNSLSTIPSLLPAAWPVEEMSFKKDPMLPISTPPAVGAPKEEQKVKKMTRQGLMVALAYMACAGKDSNSEKLI
jgi:hypothetical protein